MGGRIKVVGTTVVAGGSNPYIWSNNNNCGLSTAECVEGVSLDLDTGIFTVLPGYGGCWTFTWNVSVDSGQTQTNHVYEVIADPGGANVVVAQASRRLANGADIGNATVVGMEMAMDGGTFALRVSGDATAIVRFGCLTAHVIN